MKPILYLFAALLLSGCNDGRPASSFQGDAAQTEAMSASQNVADFDKKAGSETAQPASPAPQSAPEQKIIKEGEITFETADINTTKNRIASALKKAGGYVESESQQSSQYSSKTVTLTVRIPAQRFDSFVQNLSAKDDQIVEKNIRLRDVTAQYIDNKTRLENRQALEKRYLQLLQKATKMSDVLEIENKLADIRADVESQQGQLNYLLKQVQYSTLSISFFVKGATETSPGFLYRLRLAVSDSFGVLADVFFGVIRYWPVIVLILLVIFGLRNYRRKKSNIPPQTKS